VAKFHANQGHCYANQAVTEFHANQGHLCKLDRYTRKSEYELVWYSLGKEGKRNKARTRTKIRQQTRIVQTTRRLIKLHPPRCLTQVAVNQHPPLLPLNTFTTRRETQRSAHTRSLLGPHTTSRSFSVLQPCGSDVVLMLAVSLRVLCLHPRCPLPTS
jgi:hypothetical protein